MNSQTVQQQQQQYENLDHNLNDQMKQGNQKIPHYQIETYQQQQDSQAFVPTPSTPNINNNPTLTSVTESQPSPQRPSMSQPVTPQPSSSPRNHIEEFQSNHDDIENSNNSNSAYTSSPPESQRYNALVTPGTSRYSAGVPSDQSNVFINETCPSFSSTSYNQNIYALDRHTIIGVQLYTKIDRGFFLADNDWTCYRRNYFQVSGSFSLDGIGMLYDGQDLPCLAKDDQHGQLEEIQYFMLGVRAKLSDCDKPVPLIQHTPKRDKGPQTTPMPRLIRPGGNLGFSAVGSSQSIVTFERLQFKTATANNGKRRAAQQYYVITIELLAKLRNENIITVASAQSAPLVVRGRSPGHYAETDSTGGRVSAPRRQSRAHHFVSSASLGGPISNSIHYNHPIAANPYQRNTNPMNNTNNDTNTTATTNTTHNTAYGTQSAHPHMFPSSEYMPYEYPPYNAAGPSHYGHNYPPTVLPSMTHSSPYPLNSTASIQQGHYYSGDAGLHERVQSNTSSEATYSTPHNGQPSGTPGEYHPSMKDNQLSDPYYWQRQQAQQVQPRHYQHHGRMRMTSNQSTTTTTTNSMDHQQHSQQDSPYLHHQPPQQPAHYYPQPHSSHSQGHYHPGYTHQTGMAQSSASMPDHYTTGYPYEWRPPQQQSTHHQYKMPMYTYGNTEDSRRFEYNSSERSTTTASFTNAIPHHEATTSTTTTTVSSPHDTNNNRNISSPTLLVKETTAVN
ncbi:hypothetical protein BDF20DRAFT_913005 [Mycotypha africana]|uniref:uncharacterized protein n=1 Tax=Mycotypha africana TaxID=64632 RepID=UPI002300D5F7|nr:uncharacterized protein BDF20DRAFT_913005 [Mycotypha africana]KAI8979419.1 hypothetical protein BDF20DRAFT_913005 [Mycotypha africana]